MKKLLLLVLVLFMGACSTDPSVNEPTVYPPIIGPELDKTGENPTEKLLKGEWIGSINSKNKVIYKYSNDLGKQELSYDNLGNLVSHLSYEIKEDYFTDASTGKQTHLLVEYGDEKNTEFKEQPYYYEISEIDNDTYKMYMRIYRWADKDAEFFLKDPKKTIRLGVDGVDMPLDYKRVK